MRLIIYPDAGMNVFLIKWDYNNEDNLAIAKGLENQGHKIKYWVGTSPEDVSSPSRRNFTKTVFHNIFDAIAGRPAAEFKDISFPPPGEKTIKDFFETESILATIKQFEKLTPSVLEKKSVYHGFLEYWFGIINKLKPEAVIFSVQPHAGFDFVLYSIAKHLKIKTVIFEYTGVSDRHFVINDYSVGCDKLRKEIEDNRGKAIGIKDLSSDIREFYLRQADRARQAISKEVGNIKKSFSGFNLVLIKLRMLKRAIADFSFLKKSYFYFKKKLGKNFRKEYIEVQIQPDWNKKFIYLALHYQPEAATSPLGGVFVDQLLMIKNLAYALPDNWVIYVKEHPVQWLISGLNYTSFRYPGYYKSISEIKNVKIVPIDTSAEELIEKSEAVATITGSAGREALLRKKPVIIFGYPNYRYCPGAFKVNDVLSCQAAITKIKSGFILEERDILNYLYSLDRISIHTYFEISAKKLSKLTPAEHVEIMTGAIVRELEAKPFGAI
ncbi:MAG: hypothetical protein WC745_01070 [Patescibacteria group bacterium]|jgi:hypothetical protein